MGKFALNGKIILSVFYLMLILTSSLVFMFTNIDLVFGQTSSAFVCSTTHNENWGETVGSIDDGVNCYEDGILKQYCITNQNFIKDPLTQEFKLSSNYIRCEVYGMNTYKVLEKATGYSLPWDYCSSIGGIHSSANQNSCYFTSSKVNVPTDQVLTGSGNTIGVRFIPCSSDSPSCSKNEVPRPFLPLSLPTDTLTPLQSPSCNPDNEECRTDCAPRENKDENGQCVLDNPPPTCPDGEHLDENGRCIPDNCLELPQQFGQVFPLEQNNVIDINEQYPNCQDMNTPPVAIATADPNPVHIGKQVFLDGRQSFDPDSNDSLKYEWKQIDNSGSKVDLTINKDETVSFIAPSIIPRTTGTGGTVSNVPLQFKLKVNDIHNASSSDVVSVYVQCSDTNEEKIKEAENRMDNSISGWIILGFNHAVNGYNVWKSGQQIDPLTLDAEWLRSYGFVKSAEKFNEQRFESGGIGNSDNSLTDLVKKASSTGQIQVLDAYLDRAIDAGYDSDYYWTIGESHLKSSAVISVIPLGNDRIQIQGTITHKIQDIYNFNPGDVFGLIYTVEADDLNLLKKCRTANDYTQFGKWTKQVDITGDVQNISKMLQTGKLPWIIV